MDTQRLLAGLDRMWFSRAGRGVRSAAAEAFGLAAPVWCLGCRAQEHRPGEELCADCTADFRAMTARPFRAEGHAEALPVTGIQSPPAAGDGLVVLPAYAAGFYSTLISELVIRFKDDERIRLRPLLAAALSRSLDAAAQQTCVPGGSEAAEVLLIWPPTSPRSRIRRGRCPVTELVTACRLPPGCIPTTGLVRHSGSLITAVTGDAQKTRSKRRRRQAGSQFILTPGAAERLSGADVLLIDDVLTTGATLAALYGVLTAAGARVHAAAVLAATPPAGW